MKEQDIAPAPDGSVSESISARKGWRPLRTWPALLLAILVIAARFGPAYLEGGLGRYWMIAVFGPLLCCVLMLLWWVTFSRATGKEKIFGFLCIIGLVALTVALVEPTMRGPGTTYLTIPMGMVGFALATTLLRQRQPLARTGTALLAATVGFGYSALLRNEGMTGDYVLDTHWRWSPTSEHKLLAQSTAAASPKPAAAESAQIAQILSNPEWPGFRGADRASRSQAPLIDTNWAAHPPQQLWRIDVGPGWSSFAVAGRLLFTQEQRGPMEAVICYDADTGREIWKREFEARLEDPLGGPGPRATPTIADGALFVTGATGKFMRLKPATGEIVWSKDLPVAAARTVPMWGFSASPVVTGGLVIVYGGGSGDKGLLAFDAATGEQRWGAATGIDSYSSPQLNTIQGENSVLMLSNEGLVLVDPATGQERLNYPWKFSGYRALQPHLVGSDTILLQTPMNAGTRAIRITKPDGRLAVEELWTTRNLKPDFSDLITFEGYAYGNDAGIMTCIDLKSGERKWKGGRYGKGQILLLEKSRMLLVLSEQGQVFLVQADPGAHTEVASFKALEGKTWNHPVVVGDRLYVRNSQEAAAYRLPLPVQSAAEKLSAQRNP